MGVPALRSEVLNLCDDLQGILAFNYSYGEQSRESLELIRAEVPTAPARLLREFRDRLRASVVETTRRFGLRRQATKAWRQLLKEFKDKSKDSLGKPLMPKFAIDTFFSNYADKFVDWQSYPPHLLVGMDFTGEQYRPGQFDWVLPEASLYEDMCMAYNMALDANKIASSFTIPARGGKLSQFCIRAAVLSAFYFVEAYLNGVAFDFVIRNGKTLSEQEAEFLMEWDGKLNREKWVNFKDKLYKYPRVISGSQHPLLTDSNSAEVKLLLTKAKEVRDSVVHQSPKPDFSTIGLPGTKLASFIHLRLADATEIVDASISVVRKLNAALGKNGINVDWLFDRDASGRFPENAFL